MQKLVKRRALKIKLLAAVGLALAATADVSAGKLAVAIVLPEMPTASESFAAKELKYHLEKATGETVSIVAEGESVGRDDPIAPHASTSNLVGRDDPIAPPAGSCGLPVRRFYVGNTKALANAGIDYASLQAEERVVKGVVGDVYLKSPRVTGFVICFR